MQKAGRRKEALNERQVLIVREYLYGGDTLKEVAKKYDMCAGTLQYWVAKYRHTIAQGGEVDD